MHHREHLSRLKLADIFLDTFPYNAHTTASDALRLGIPVVTLKGQSFASRVASSLLNCLDLNELTTDNENEYQKVAIKLAENNSFLHIKNSIININGTEKVPIKIKSCDNSAGSIIFENSNQFVIFI